VSADFKFLKTSVPMSGHTARNEYECVRHIDSGLVS
jgi:hypothetical protein